jgi:uncharacterized protein (DUF433 family)
MVAVEVLRMQDSWIEKASGKCGGRANIRDTRISVWSVVVAQRLGLSAGTEEIEADIRDDDNVCVPTMVPPKCAKRWR